MKTINLRPHGMPGVWGYDDDGELWGTTGPVEPPEHCAICGTELVIGYRSGIRSGSQLVCLSHIQWEPKNAAEEAS